MKALIQKVDNANVSVEDKTVGRISKGLLVLLGITKEDTEKDLDYIVEKTINLRIFEDENGKFDLSVSDVNGEILLVSQFTLCADCKKGRRPDFGNAAPASEAKLMFEKAVNAFKKTGIVVEQGQFQAYMKVALINDGPVTIILDTKP